MGNLNKHDRTYKSYMRALKELDKINEQMRRLPYRKLEEPYQSGWNLLITLRDDYLRSKKGAVVNTLVEKFGVRGFTRSSKLVSRIRKKPLLLDVKRLTPTSWQCAPDIRSITKKEYNALTPQQQKYFFWSPYGHGFHHRADSYHLEIPHHYLIVKVEKRIITHVQDIDPDLISRKAELWVMLEPYWREMGRGEGYYHRHLNRRERRRVKVEMSKVTIDE